MEMVPLLQCMSEKDSPSNKWYTRNGHLLSFLYSEKALQAKVAWVLKIFSF
jgi:hypothetical protein